MQDKRFHLGAEFLHGHLCVVKHLKLLLQAHLKHKHFQIVTPRNLLHSETTVANGIKGVGGMTTYVP